MEGAAAVGYAKRFDAFDRASLDMSGEALAEGLKEGCNN